jgi:hypothetical protein
LLVYVDQLGYHCHFNAFVFYLVAGAGFTFICCTYECKGGGKPRLQLHLAKQQRDCQLCSRVPSDVCEIMKEVSILGKEADNKEHKLMAERTLLEREKQRVRYTQFMVAQSLYDLWCP